ncbi:hypothetical protein PsYK624_131900 [Phanerochaete sordida]|uniref:Uncharacterized protein n=1 Tax=Phanerochaete sordida TaxID=48140 RepID=A0A9P3GKM5_9APHY|nr:hypothetical protein PsYK624_131900 [Phanerochaete sordida]
MPSWIAPHAARTTQPRLPGHRASRTSNEPSHPRLPRHLPAHAAHAPSHAPPLAAPIRARLPVVHLAAPGATPPTMPPRGLFVDASRVRKAAPLCGSPGLRAAAGAHVYSCRGVRPAASRAAAPFLVHAVRQRPAAASIGRCASPSTLSASFFRPWASGTVPRRASAGPAAYPAEPPAAAAHTYKVPDGAASIRHLTPGHRERYSIRRKMHAPSTTRPDASPTTEISSEAAPPHARSAVPTDAPEPPRPGEGAEAERARAARRARIVVTEASGASCVVA